MVNLNEKRCISEQTKQLALYEKLIKNSTEQKQYFQFRSNLGELYFNLGTMYQISIKGVKDTYKK